MANEAFKFSGKAAADYDQYLGPILFEPYALDLVSKIDDFNVGAVLEIACGTGRVTRHLRKRFGAHVSLVASDFNADMLHVAENKLKGQPIEFRVEDAQNLSFSNESFDLVVCQFGLMFLQDKEKGLREVMRVLKPGGTFIFSTWEKTDNVPLFKTIFNDMILPNFKDEPTARLLVPFSLSDPALLTAWLEETNFIDIKATRIVLASQAPSPDEIVNGLFVKHSIGKEILDKDPEAFRQTADKMTRIITQQFGGAHPSFELAAFLVSARKAG
jgi:SAM-dependent methyltransferase